MTDLYLKMPEKIKELKLPDDKINMTNHDEWERKKNRTPLYEDDDQSDNKEMEPDQHTGAVCQVNETKKRLKKEQTQMINRWKTMKTDENLARTWLRVGNGNNETKQEKHQSFPKW